MSDHTLASSSESMLLAAQVLPTSSPINVVSTASVVPAPTANQFSRELEDIRAVAEVLVSTREGPNTTHSSHTLDTIPETQDLDIDREVVLPNVSVGVGHLLYEEIVDHNATTLPMHSTPGIDLPVIRIQTAGTEYISPVFRYISTVYFWMGSHTQTTRHITLVYLKSRFHQGNMLSGNMLRAKLLPVCCWIQRDTCCRDTGNMLPATSNMLPGNMLPWCKCSLTALCQNTMNELIKSNASSEALHYRQDLLLVTTREHTSLHIHVVKKITIIRAQKIGNPRFEISYSVVAPSGDAEKKLNMGAQLQTITYIKPPKLFKNLHGLD